jgi:quinol monooxygenase YgiN
MANLQVIARFVACAGSEKQLRALLQRMLTPTRAESGCELGHDGQEFVQVVLSARWVGPVEMRTRCQ